jgi:hypothetical protein
MDGQRADWYPDPDGRHEFRYWNGSAWTEHVADQGQLATDAFAGTSAPIAPEVPSAPEPLVPWDAPEAPAKTPEQGGVVRRSCGR